MLTFGCCLRVDNDEIVVIERCGKFRKVKHGGLRALGFPFIDRIKARFSKRLQEMFLNLETKTSDDVFIKLGAAVQFRILAGKEKKVFYEVADPMQYIEHTAGDILRQIISQRDLETIFAAKDMITQEAKVDINQIIAFCGLEIVDICTIEIVVSREVRGSMDVYNSVIREREAVIENQDAKALETRLLAEGEMEKKILLGQGEKDRRKAVFDGLIDCANGMNKFSINDHETMIALLKMQYLQVLKKEMGTNTGNLLLFRDMEDHEKQYDLLYTFLTHNNEPETKKNNPLDIPGINPEIRAMSSHNKLIRDSLAARESIAYPEVDAIQTEHGHSIRDTRTYRNSNVDRHKYHAPRLSIV